MWYNSVCELYLMCGIEYIKCSCTCVKILLCYHDVYEVKFPPAVAQLVERQTVELAEICWSLVRFRAAGRFFYIHYVVFE